MAASASSIKPDTTHWLKIVSGGDAVIDVAVHQWSAASPHTTAFCLHGFAGNAMDFAVLASTLKQAGITTVAVDMPGRGSSAFLGDTARYTLRLQQLVISEAFALVDGPVIALGTSWGGAIIGALTPYLRTELCGVVLVDTPMVSGPDTFYPYEDFLRNEADLEFVSLQSARIYLSATRNLFHLPSDQIDDLMSGAIMASGAGFRMRYDPALAQTLGRGAAFDLVKSIGKRNVQTLAVLGANSHLLTAPSQITARRALSGLSEHICPHEAHPPSLTQPDQIEAIVRFMQGCQVSGGSASV